MQRRQFLQYLSFGAVVTWGGSLPAYAASDEEAPKDFFALKFSDLQGDEVDLQPYQGRPLVVNFWASWCPPCVEEMPDLEQLSQAYPEVQFLGLAIDTQRNIKKFLQEVPVTYDLLIPGYAGVEVMRDLGNSKGGLPFTVLFNAQGEQHKHILGQIDPQSLSEDIEALQAGTEQKTQT
ncbi:MAG TPA: TlpA disulfide reductase family protein [Paenalcaligenes sp.]|nr:TlpA disulfide reductase family protein [Paenalcaligenes sp.]